MVLDINSTGTLGLILLAGTQTLTGNLFLTLMLIFLFLLCVAIAFNIPMEFTLIIFLPLVLGCMAFYNNFISTGASIFIVLSFIITKNFLFK